MIGDPLTTQSSRSRPIWIYSDGSASTHGQKTGAHAAHILFPDGEVQMVVGACSQTKINRMELSAINQALYYIWAIHEKGGSLDLEIEIVTDSEVTMNGATGKNKRGPQNADLWLQFDSLSENFKSINFTHVDRNTEAPQAQSDVVAHLFRVQLEDLLNRVLLHEMFGKMQLTKETRFDEDPLPAQETPHEK